MGLHIQIDGENKKVDLWACLTSGCVAHVESEHFVDASVDDKKENGMRIRKSLSLRKREGYIDVIHNIMNGDVPVIGDEPKADEGELLEVLKFVMDKIAKGMRYVGVKTEFTTPRGIQVYFRLRFNELPNGPYVIVDLMAEKEGERMTYQTSGQTSNIHTIRKEALKAIGAYILFSEYVAKQTDQQGDQH
jgi:hypothetical protein